MYKLLLIILGLGFGVNNLYSQWIQTDGPYEDMNVVTAFEHDSKYFASTYSCGLFSKYPDEQSWSLISDIHIGAYTIKGDSLFADAHHWTGGSSHELGVYLFDLTNPWDRPKPINPIPSNALIHTDTCLFGGNEINGFYKMGFDGSDLEYFNEGLPVDTIFSPWQPPVFQIHVTEVELTSVYLFAGTGKGIYRSTHALSGWEEVNNGLAPGRVTFIESIRDTLFAGLAENLYFSLDEGNSWMLLHTTPSKITSFQKKDNRLFVSTEADGIYNSPDNGASWSGMNSGLEDLSVNFIIAGENTTFCGTHSMGVFEYEKGSWEADNSGMICSFIRDMTNTNSKLVASTDKHVYLQNGFLYSEITPGFRSDLFPNADHRGDTIFVSSYYIQSRWPYIFQSIFFTSDDGNIWAEIDSLPYTSAGGDSEHKIYIKGSTIYGWSGDKLYFTDNMGSSWRNMNLPQQYCNSFEDFLVFKGTPIAAACGIGQLIRRNNSGQWILSNIGLPNDRGPQKIAYCDGALFTWILVHGMYVSMDDGNTWSYAGNGLKAGDFGIRDFAAVGQHLYVVTEKGVFGTKDFGQQWYSCNTGLKNVNASSMKFLNDSLYVGTYGNGIWKRAINDIVLSVGETEMVNNNIRVYPNPASEYIMIESNSTLDYISILDLLGRPILSEKPTENQVDIRNVHAGIYILMIRSGQEYYITKIIIE